ncbi:MAG: DUF2062 domain-containing protein [Nannocystaceae bacterium]|nr:DUF2062 domain-containing protein [Nannocystaceae bacterium]
MMARLRTALRSLLTLGGSPRGIAGGFVLGMSLSLLPVPFAGMFVALAIAPLLRCNLPATYVGTAVVNPLTGAFFYATELWLGLSLLGRSGPGLDELQRLDAAGFFALLGQMLGPFLLGAAVLAAGATAVGYPLVYAAVARWRHDPANDEGADPQRGSTPSSTSRAGR